MDIKECKLRSEEGTDGEIIAELSGDVKRSGPSGFRRFLVVLGGKPVVSAASVLLGSDAGERWV